MDIDKVVASYVACRDHLAEVRKEFKGTELEHKSQMAIMETAIMEEADRQGVESFKTKHGTAFKVKKDFISVENWSAALDHMISNDLTHLLTKSVGKAAAKEYMDEHGGALPPGLKYGYIPAISIRRK